MVGTNGEHELHEHELASRHVCLTPYLSTLPSLLHVEPRHEVGEWNMGRGSWHHPQGHGQFRSGDVRNWVSEVAGAVDGSAREELAMALGANAKRQRLS